MWYEQFNNLCKEKSTTPTAFVQDELKLSSSKVTAWKNGSIPKIEILQKIAEYFNVTVGYLFDGKEKSSSSDLSEEEQEFLQKFKNLSTIDKGRILERMETMLSSYTPEQKENAS